MWSTVDAVLYSYIKYDDDDGTYRLLLDSICFPIVTEDSLKTGEKDLSKAQKKKFAKI